MVADKNLTKKEIEMARLIMIVILLSILGLTSTGLAEGPIFTELNEITSRPIFAEVNNADIWKYKLESVNSVLERVDSLATVLANTKDINVQDRAISALDSIGQSGFAEVIPVLAKAAFNPEFNMHIQANAAFALLPIKDARIDTVFINAFQNDTLPINRALAAPYVAGRLKEDAIPILRFGVLNDESALVKQIAALSLAEIGDEGIATLSEIASEDRYGFDIKEYATSTLTLYTDNYNAIQALFRINDINLNCARCEGSSSELIIIARSGLLYRELLNKQQSGDNIDAQLLSTSESYLKELSSSDRVSRGLNYIGRSLVIDLASIISEVSPQWEPDQATARLLNDYEALNSTRSLNIGLPR